MLGKETYIGAGTSGIHLHNSNPRLTQENKWPVDGVLKNAGREICIGTDTLCIHL